MQGRLAGRAGGGAGMRRRTAGNVERGRRTVRPGDEAAATATWAAGVGVGTITACWRRRGTSAWRTGGRSRRRRRRGRRGHGGGSAGTGARHWTKETGGAGLVKELAAARSGVGAGRGGGRSERWWRGAGNREEGRKWSKKNRGSSYIGRI